jgi:hypothetical protein
VTALTRLLALVRWDDHPAVAPLLSRLIRTRYVILLINRGP